MSKTHRLHKIIKYCVDQTNAQKIVFVGKKNDISPYLTDDCVIKTGEDDLIGADVLIYLGEDQTAQRADLSRTSKIVLIDESNSHDRHMSLDHGFHREIHIGSHLGQQYCLDRAYPPFILYTHVHLDNVYSLAGYDSEEDNDKFSTVSCFFYDTVGKLESTTSETNVPADEPTTTLASVPPAVEPIADTTTNKPLNESNITSNTTTTVEPSVDSDTSTTPIPRDSSAEDTGSEGVTSTTEEPIVDVEQNQSTDAVVPDNDVTTTTLDVAVPSTVQNDTNATTGEPVNDDTRVDNESVTVRDDEELSSTTTTESTVSTESVDSSDSGTTTTIDPERQRALDLFDTKPLSKMTDEEKQFLRDQGLI